MTFRPFKPACQGLLLFVLVCLLPLTANSTTDEEVLEKRTRVAMRMLGHEILMSFGDQESRVMPIERINGHYKISFEADFGADPDDIVSAARRVMAETRVATDYLVEVEQCETKAVVHSFEIRNAIYTGLVPCAGRLLPKDCYSLLVTILDGTRPAPSLVKTAKNSSLASSGRSNWLKSVYFIIPLLILLGFIAYFVRKRNPANPPPHLILIGASQFDKRNRMLSFENHKVELSHKEAELLSVLHTSANAPLEREVILQRVWGDEGDYVGRTLDVFISKLRKKLEIDASVKIVNIRGVGYQLVMEG